MMGHANGVHPGFGKKKKKESVFLKEAVAGNKLSQPEPYPDNVGKPCIQ